MPVNTSITFRKGSSSQWNSTNPVLASGEPGYDLTNNILKIGDGVSNWNNLKNVASISGLISASSGNFNSLSVGGIPVSISGHIHIGDDILIESDDFNSTTLSKGSSSAQFLEQLNTNGLTEAMNTVGGCNAETIKDFNSSVSGLLPTISNSGNNRILTSIGSSVGINAENNLTFDNHILYVSGIGQIGEEGAYTYIGHDMLGGDLGITANNDTYLAVKIMDGTDQLRYGGNSTSPAIVISSGINVGIKTFNPVYTLDVNGSGNFASGLYVNNIPVSVSGHTHTASNISGLNASATELNYLQGVTPGSGLGNKAVVLNALGSAQIPFINTYGLEAEAISVSDPNYSSVVYLEPAHDSGGSSKLVFIGNNTPNGSIEADESAEILNFVGPWNLNGTPISVSGHSHTSSNITNFNSSVSGLVSGIYAPLSGKLNQFASTSSAELFGIISDDTGSGLLVFNTSPSFSGVPTVPTASAGTNTTQAASTAFVRTEISNLVASAPSTLDTLNELANALGNDANFSTTVTNSLASKANLSGATFTGAISGPSGDFTSLRQNGVSVQTLLTNPVTGVGTSGYLSRWNGTNSVTSGIIFDNGSRIGINNPAPSSVLDVIGESRIQGLLYFNQNSTDANDTSRNRCSITREGDQQLILRGGSNSLNLSGDGGKIIIRSSTVGTEIGGDGANTYVSFHPGSNIEKARITPSGFLGIGTSTPSGQLHVIGTGIVSSRLGVGITSPQYALDVVGSGNFLNGLAISGVPLGEIIDDEVAGLLVAGSGISLNYNDSANTLTIATSGLTVADISGAASLPTTGLTITRTGDWVLWQSPPFFNLVPAQAVQFGDNYVRYSGKWIANWTYSETTWSVGPRITSLTFHDLEGVVGNFSPTSLGAITTLSLPALRYVGGSFSPALLTSLTTLSVPALEYILGGINVTGVGSLTTLSFPALSYLAGNIAPGPQTGTISTISMPALTRLNGDASFTYAGLTSLSLPLLSSVGGSLTIGSNQLTTLSLPNLIAVGGSLSFSSMTNLTTLSLPSLAYVGSAITNGFNVSAPASLTTLSLPSMVSLSPTQSHTISGTSLANLTFPTDGRFKVSGNMTITGSALTQASVNNILQAYASLDGTNGTTSFTGTLNISGGTSAAPSNLGSTTTAGSNFVCAGTTCTVNWTNHGYATGDVLRISGITTATNANRYARITVVNANQFTYTITSQNATGAGTATVVRAGTSASALVTRGVTLTTN